MPTATANNPRDLFSQSGFGLILGNGGYRLVFRLIIVINNEVRITNLLL